MKVAPSYENYRRVGEPFTKNGKQYIKVEHPNTKNLRDARLYTEAEYAKAYGKKLSSAESVWGGLKQARGFSEGPILCLRGGTAADEEWFKRSIARYAVGIEWYIVSTDTIPLDIPKHLTGVLLHWEEFKLGDDRHMKTPEALAAIISAKLKNGKDLVKFG